jgi:formate hydrogenlyase subunit 3/multisubunit Na+/H+ antiporter MnhD subunit
LLGTILLYFAARNLVSTHNALLLTQLFTISHELSPSIASLAFIFLIVGYGTKAGLVPLHNWLPDAHGEGPAPVSALLSGLLLNIAVYAIVRCQTIVEVATGAPFTHQLLMGFGLLNVLIAAFFLLRQKEIKRLYAYSSIEHIGLIIFAFGLGTPLALFAALFHMAMHSLSKTAAFFGAGQAIQCRNTYSIAHIRGLIQDYPGLGWGVLLSSLALLGMPPFGIFVSEFLILFTTIQQYPWLGLLLLIGLLIAFAALFNKVQAMVFTESELITKSKETMSLFPLYIHMGVVFVLGLWVPIYLSGWLNQIVQLLRGVP